MEREKGAPRWEGRKEGRIYSSFFCCYAYEDQDHDCSGGSSSRKVSGSLIAKEKNTRVAAAGEELARGGGSNERTGG
jgi:hypothetical protein